MAYIRVIVPLVAILAGVVPIPAFAYERQVHEGITQAVVRGYEKLHGDTFSTSEEGKIIAGSSAEDDDWRFLNHFYDPINYRGLTVLGIALGAPSESWAYDTRGQATWRCIAYFPCSHDIGYNDKLFSSPTDYSWERAIYDYAYGDKQRGLEALGHILHFIEDATVPAHVRNDQHGHIGSVGDADPYETFTSQFTSANINVPDALSNVPTYSSLSSYLDHVARFTNTRFVSKDTLFKDYDLPRFNEAYTKGDFVYDAQTGSKIARVESLVDKFTHKLIRRNFFIDDINDSVVKDNWNILSKTAVLNGIGVVDLFFRSVEQEKKTGAILAKNISAAEQNAKDLAKNGFKYVKALYGSSLDQSDVEELLNDNAGQAGAAALTVAEQPSPPQQSPPPTKPPAPAVGETKPQSQAAPQVLGSSISPAEESTEQEPPQQEPTPAAPAPEFSTTNSGGVSGGSPTQNTVSAPQSDDTSAVEAPALSLSILSPAENEIFATTTVTFTGTTSAAATVTAAYDSTLATSTTDGDGNWAFTLTLASGTTTVSFSAATSTLTTATSTRTVLVDTAAPAAPDVSIGECSASFGAADCTIATTTVTVTWSGVADVAYYGVIKDNTVFSTTTATGTTSVVVASATTTFAVVAYKSNGLSATSTDKTVFVTTQPLTISEIGWAGTNASADDEWLELRNMTSATLDLSHFIITTPDGSRTIQLSGTVAAAGDTSAHDFFLVERNSEATSAVPPNTITVDFASLADGGEQLLLQWGNGAATTTIDSTPAVVTCGGWCAGASQGSVGYSVQSGTSTGQLSMERKNGAADGLLAASWQTADGYTLGAFDRNSSPIYGTPGANNSKGNPSAGWFCSPDTVSIVSGAHYTPPSSSCTYLMRAISTQANRYGALYRGDVGSSTLMNAHFDGRAYIRQHTNAISSPQAGEHFFIAIYEIRFDNDQPAFDTYFKTGVRGPQMHDNYFVIPWIYGP